MFSIVIQLVKQDNEGPPQSPHPLAPFLFTSPFVKVLLTEASQEERQKNVSFRLS